MGLFPFRFSRLGAFQRSFFPKTRAVNFLKLRGSWGILGNDRLNINISSYLSVPTEILTRRKPCHIWNNVAQQTIFEGRLGNPNVTWETVKKLDIGIDATLYNGLFNLTADYFNDKRMIFLATFCFYTWFSRV
jgi:hypothetical protein